MPSCSRYRLGAMPPYHQITGLGRTLHPRHPSNRFAVVGAAAAFACFVVIDALRGAFTPIAAGAAAIAVFLAWAIGRELDPDTPRVASVALVLAAVAAVWFTPSAVASGVALVALRVVAGTVGAPLSRYDVAALALIGAACGVDVVTWLAALAIGAWLWSAPEVGRLGRVGIVALVVGFVCGIAFTWWRTGAIVPDNAVTGWAYVLAAAAAAAMILSVRVPAVRTRTDADTGIIDTLRVRLARITAGSFSMWAAVMAGVDGFWQIGPVFAAMGAVAVFRVFVHPAFDPSGEG